MPLNIDKSDKFFQHIDPQGKLDFDVRRLIANEFPDAKNLSQVSRPFRSLRPTQLNLLKMGNDKLLAANPDVVKRAKERHSDFHECTHIPALNQMREIGILEGKTEEAERLIAGYRLGNIGDDLLEKHLKD